METKPALYTTEFWTMLLSSVYMFLNTVGAVNQIPDSWAAIAWAIIQALYAVGRGIAKNKGGFDPNNPNNYTLVPKLHRANPRVGR